MEFARNIESKHCLNGDVPGISGFAEYQPGGRVKIDVINRYPFRLDTIQAAVCPEATVTPESRVLLQVGTAPVAAFSSLFHRYFTFCEDFIAAVEKDLPFYLAGLLYFGSRTGSF